MSFAHTPGDPDNLIHLSEHRRDDRPVPIPQKIAERAMHCDGLGALETPTEDLQAEVSRIDAEWEALSGKPVPPSAAEARQSIARRVDIACAELMAAKDEANRDDLAELHPRVALVALEADKLLSDLADEGNAA